MFHQLGSFLPEGVGKKANESKGPKDNSPQKSPHRDSTLATSFLRLLLSKDIISRPRIDAPCAAARSSTWPLMRFKPPITFERHYQRMARPGLGGGERSESSLVKGISMIFQFVVSCVPMVFL